MLERVRECDSESENESESESENGSGSVCQRDSVYVCVSSQALNLSRGEPSGETYPVSAETLEPLARFVRKLPKDSNLAEDGFPGLINQKFLGLFGTNYSICRA